MDWQMGAGLGEWFRVLDCKPPRQRWYRLAHAWVWHPCRWVVARGASCRVRFHPIVARLCSTRCLPKLLVPLGSGRHLALGKHIKVPEHKGKAVLFFYRCYLSRRQANLPCQSLTQNT